MDKFSNTLHQTLTVFAQLLEVASLQEIGKCTEEILEYLKSIVLASPVATVTLVHQVLSPLSNPSVILKISASHSCMILASSCTYVARVVGFLFISNIISALAVYLIQTSNALLAL